MRKHLTQATALILSGFVFLTGTVFSHAYEANVWAERAANRRPSPASAQVASLPRPFQPAQVLNEIPLQRVSTTPFQKKTLPLTSSPIGRAVSALPSAFGSIRKVSPGSPSLAGASVIHIQDVHMNAEAQLNISETIRSLIDRQAVDLIALEGAFDPIDLSAFRSHPDQAAVKTASDFLLSENTISGAVHGALASARPLPAVVGIDDKWGYEQNVAAYKESTSFKVNAAKRIAAWRDELAAKKKAVYNQKLASIDSVISGYELEKISFGDYVRRIAEPQTRLSITLDALLETLQLEYSIDFGKVEDERARLIRELVDRLSKEQVSRLVDDTVAYRMGTLQHAEFYGRLRSVCAHHGVNLSRYPAMNSYIQYVLMADSLDTERLMSELRSLERQALIDAAVTDEEKRIIRESRRLSLISRLVDAALTPDEWQEYKADVRGDDVEPIFRPFELFYVYAESREAAMMSKLSAAMSQHGAKTAVLVTGGFHAAGLGKLMKQQGMSTVGFVPRLTKVDSSKGAAYLSIFQREKTPLEQLFEGSALYLSPPVFPASAESKGRLLSDASAIHKSQGDVRFRLAPAALLKWVTASAVLFTVSTGRIFADEVKINFSGNAITSVEHAGSVLAWAQPMFAMSSWFPNPNDLMLIVVLFFAFVFYEQIVKLARGGFFLFAMSRNSQDDPEFPLSVSMSSDNPPSGGESPTPPQSPWEELSVQQRLAAEHLLVLEEAVAKEALLGDVPDYARGLLNIVKPLQDRIWKTSRIPTSPDTMEAKMKTQTALVEFIVGKAVLHELRKHPDLSRQVMVALTGSAARNEMIPSSDLDLLLFAPDNLEEPSKVLLADLQTILRTIFPRRIGSIVLWTPSEVKSEFDAFTTRDMAPLDLAKVANEEQLTVLRQSEGRRDSITRLLEMRVLVGAPAVREPIEALVNSLIADKKLELTSFFISHFNIRVAEHGYWAGLHKMEVDVKGSFGAARTYNYLHWLSMLMGPSIVDTEDQAATKKAFHEMQYLRVVLSGIPETNGRSLLLPSYHDEVAAELMPERKERWEQATQPRRSDIDLPFVAPVALMQDYFRSAEILGSAARTATIRAATKVTSPRSPWRLNLFNRPPSLTDFAEPETSTRLSHLSDHALVVENQSGIRFSNQRGLIESAAGTFEIQLKNLTGANPFRQNPVLIIEMIEASVRNGLSISYETTVRMTEAIAEFRAIDMASNSPQTVRINRSLMGILSSPNDISEAMWDLHRMKLLSHLIPEFKRIENIITMNSPHTYAIDTHVMKAIELFEKIRRNAPHPLLEEISQWIDEHQFLMAMRLAILCHDIGKPDWRNPANIPHDIIGSGKMLSQIMDRLQVPNDARDLIQWLVKNDAILAKPLRPRLLGADGMTVTAESMSYMHAAILGSPLAPAETIKQQNSIRQGYVQERMDLLIMLSFVDEAASRPGDVSADFGERRVLSDLPNFAMLRGAVLRADRQPRAELRRALQRAKIEVKEELTKLIANQQPDLRDNLSDRMINSYFGFVHPSIWIGRDPRAVLEEIVALFSTMPVKVFVRGSQSRMKKDRAREASYELTFVAKDDFPGTLAALTGVMAANGWNILRSASSAGVVKTKNNEVQSVVLDNFLANHQGAFAPDSSLQTALEEDMLSVRTGEATMADIFKKRGRPYLVELKKISSRFERPDPKGRHRLRISGEDFPGLLHVCARILHEVFQIDIGDADIETKQEVEDTLYLKTTLTPAQQRDVVAAFEWISTHRTSAPVDPDLLIKELNERVWEDPSEADTPAVAYEAIRNLLSKSQTDAENKARTERLLSAFVLRDGPLSWQTEKIERDNTLWADDMRGFMADPKEWGLGQLLEILEDDFKVVRFLMVLSALREIHAPAIPKASDQAPIEYAAARNLIFRLGDLAIVSTSESFRRHIIYRAGSRIIEAVELKMPGDERTSVPIANFLVPEALHKKFPDDPGVAPALMYTNLSGKLVLYGKPFNFENTGGAGLVLYKYKEGRRGGSNQRAYRDRIAQARGYSAWELQVEIEAQWVATAIRLHRIGWSGNSEHIVPPVFDMHNQNVKLLFSGEGILVGDFGAAYFWGVGKVPLALRRKETRALIIRHKANDDLLLSVVQNLTASEMPVTDAASWAKAALEELNVSEDYPNLMRALDDLVAGRTVREQFDGTEGRIMQMVLNTAVATVKPRTLGASIAEAQKLANKLVAQMASTGIGEAARTAMIARYIDRYLLRTSAAVSLRVEAFLEEPYSLSSEELFVPRFFFENGIVDKTEQYLVLALIIPPGTRPLPPGMMSIFQRPYEFVNRSAIAGRHAWMPHLFVALIGFGEEWIFRGVIQSLLSAHVLSQTGLYAWIGLFALAFATVLHWRIFFGAEREPRSGALWGARFGFFVGAVGLGFLAQYSWVAAATVHALYNLWARSDGRPIGNTGLSRNLTQRVDESTLWSQWKSWLKPMGFVGLILTSNPGFFNVKLIDGEGGKHYISIEFGNDSSVKGLTANIPRGIGLTAVLNVFSWMKRSGVGTMTVRADAWWKHVYSVLKWEGRVMREDKTMPSSDFDPVTFNFPDLDFSARPEPFQAAKGEGTVQAIQSLLAPMPLNVRVAGEVLRRDESDAARSAVLSHFVALARRLFNKSSALIKYQWLVQRVLAAAQVKVDSSQFQTASHHAGLKIVFVGLGQSAYLRRFIDESVTGAEGRVIFVAETDFIAGSVRHIAQEMHLRNHTVLNVQRKGVFSGRVVDHDYSVDWALLEEALKAEYQRKVFKASSLQVIAPENLVITGIHTASLIDLEVLKRAVLYLVDENMKRAAFGLLSVNEFAEQARIIQKQA